MSFSDVEKSSANNYSHNMKDQFQRLVYGRSEEAFAAGDAARDAITFMAQLERRINSSSIFSPANTPGTGISLNLFSRGI